MRPGHLQSVSEKPQIQVAMEWIPPQNRPKTLLYRWIVFCFYGLLRSTSDLDYSTSVPSNVNLDEIAAWVSFAEKVQSFIRTESL